VLVELAVGDAYGAGFEYANRQLIRQFNDLSRYHQHPRHSGTHPGMYTDDTQMTLAIAELMVEDTAWTPRNIAQKFVECFKRDMREGYAGSFHGFLRQVRDGEEFLARIRPDSDKSGAAMRAAPLGIYPTIKEVLERCEVQAAVTHNTPDGIHAACAAALLTHYCLYDLGALPDAGKFIEAHVPGEWADEWHGQVGSKGWMSVKAAITVVQQHTGLAAMLKACVDYSGDVDTVATIALGAASCSAHVAQDLPQKLIDDLENGTFGRDYLQTLNAKLMALGKR
jgi:ADP-ribosyl-[dinitrogen reductase] hydrolase